MDATLATIFDRAQNAMNSRKPFVMYSKPNQKTITAIFQYDETLYPIDFESAGFAFCSFDNARHFFIPNRFSETVIAQYTQSSLAPFDWSPTYFHDEKIAFELLVAKGIAEIKNGTFGKVVLSRKEIVELNDDFITIYERLLSTYESAFRYCWYHPQTGIWMGATPEKLLSTKDKSFKTVALAGTQRFANTENVVWPEKEKAEQRFVSDFIADGLRGHTSEMNVSDPYTARAGSLLHIKTDIGGTFTNESSLKKIVEILHPTPAVCGYPKPAAKKFILENEGYDREFYSGYLGEIDASSSDLFVNLRCMKIEKNSAHLYVGCGITIDSDPEKEFEETVNKALTMKNTLRINP